MNTRRAFLKTLTLGAAIPILNFDLHDHGEDALPPGPKPGDDILLVHLEVIKNPQDFSYLMRGLTLPAGTKHWTDRKLAKYFAAGLHIPCDGMGVPFTLRDLRMAIDAMGRGLETSYREVPGA